ncbi:MAG: ADP-forming succinate--CoA ligase subunit beta [Burkholderiales bacterium]|nr:ADP-forming succinate--CoA ligase subunit beta [Burkholderiales bacterium]
MKIHEYQGKQLLTRYGVTVPRGRLAYAAAEAVQAARALGGSRWVVKAQIHAGGRGKGGGVRVVDTFEAVEDAAHRMLGHALDTAQTGAGGQLVRRLWVEEAVGIAHEYYLAVVTDRASQTLTLIGSGHGGMEIEEVAARDPDAIVRIRVDPLDGLSDTDAARLASGMGIVPDRRAAACELFRTLLACYLETDATLLEINPLVETSDGRLVALDAKFDFDANALFRHEDISALRDLDEEDPLEVAARQHDLAYIHLDGNIGCLVNGAGLAMATMDTIQLFGGKPANFLDVGGGATAAKVTEAFRIMLANPRVEAILVNIFGGIMRCDTIAEGVIAACRAVDLRLPLIVRMKGTHDDLGKQMLAASGIAIIPADSLAEAAERAVAAARGSPGRGHGISGCGDGHRGQDEGAGGAA